jgi:hypothetical protein
LLVLGDDRFRIVAAAGQEFNWVARADGPLDHDLGDPPAAADDQLGEIGVPLLQVVARDADVGQLDDARAADLQPIALGEPLEVEPAGGEVLADVAGRHVHALLPEPAVQLLAVKAHGPIRPAVVLAVALPIPGDALARDAGLADRELGHPAAGDV